MATSEALWNAHYSLDGLFTKPAPFVGRQALLRTLVHALRNPHESIIGLYGMPRIGKTALLQQLAKWLSRAGAFQAVYFDLGGRSASSFEELLEEMAKGIARALHLPPPRLDDNNNVEVNFRQNWLPTVLHQLPADTHLVLLLDEFKRLSNKNAQQIAKVFFSFLAQILSEHPQQLKCLITLNHANEEDHTNQQHLLGALFPKLSSYPVPLLGWDETLLLIDALGKERFLNWSDDALARLWTLTYGHPALIKQLYQHIWERTFLNPGQFLFRENVQVTFADVEVAARDILAKEENLAWLWQGLLLTEQWVLLKLALSDGEKLEQDQSSQIAETLTPLLARKTVQQLAACELVEARNGRGYEIRIDLLRRWIQQHQPVVSITAILAASHAVSETTIPFVSVNQDKILPRQDTQEAITAAAENLYQAALTLCEHNHHTQAISLLWHAIKLDPNHTQADQLLHESLSVLDASEAVELFESLFAQEAPRAPENLAERPLPSKNHLLTTISVPQTETLATDTSSEADARLTKDRDAKPVARTVFSEDVPLSDYSTQHDGLESGNAPHHDATAAPDLKIHQMQAEIANLREQLQAERKAHAETKLIAEREVRQLWAQLKAEVSALRRQMEAERKVHAEVKAALTQEIEQLKQQMASELATLQSQLALAQPAQRGIHKVIRQEAALLRQQPHAEAPALQNHSGVKRSPLAIPAASLQSRSQTRQSQWTTRLERLWMKLKPSPEQPAHLSKRGFITSWLWES